MNPGCEFVMGLLKDIVPGRVGFDYVVYFWFHCPEAVVDLFVKVPLQVSEEVLDRTVRLRRISEEGFVARPEDCLCLHQRVDDEGVQVVGDHAMFVEWLDVPLNLKGLSARHRGYLLGDRGG